MVGKKKLKVTVSGKGDGRGGKVRDHQITVHVGSGAAGPRGGASAPAGAANPYDASNPNEVREGLLAQMREIADAARREEHVAAQRQAQLRELAAGAEQARATWDELYGWRAANLSEDDLTIRREEELYTAEDVKRKALEFLVRFRNDEGDTGADFVDDAAFVGSEVADHIPVSDSEIYSELDRRRALRRAAVAAEVLDIEARLARTAEQRQSGQRDEDTLRLVAAATRDEERLEGLNNFLDRGNDLPRDVRILRLGGDWSDAARLAGRRRDYVELRTLQRALDDIARTEQRQVKIRLTMSDVARAERAASLSRILDATAGELRQQSLGPHFASLLPDA
jgi:hypothetical protein